MDENKRVLVVRSSKIDEYGWIPICCSGYGED